MVEQWYSQMPACSVVIEYSRPSPGGTVRITSSGETVPACRSSECPIEPLLTRSTVRRAPSSERITGPTTAPPKVIACMLTSGASSTSTSVISSVRRCSGPALGGSSASRR